jgi:hypothetical protein
VHKKIKSHQDVLDLVTSLFHALVSGMFAKMEIYSKLADYFLYDLEKKVATCQCHHSVVETLIQRVQRGHVTTHCIPLPSIFVEENNYKNPI